MKAYQGISWIIASFLLQDPGDCSTTKRRLCVEYKKENYLEKHEHITKLHADTAAKCMASCVRRYPCMAFNYHIMNKTCILMPEVKCMTPNSLNDSGYLFVHLQPCQLQPVWFSVLPANHAWYWVTTDDLGKHPDIINVAHSTTRYVSRTLYRGYYLIGWRRYENTIFKTIDPATPKVKCPYGELLAFSDSSSYRWIPYIPGNSLPDRALPVSQLPNGTSLYVVSYRFINAKGIQQRISGFYSHEAKFTYFVWVRAANPAFIHILCGTDI